MISATTPFPSNDYAAIKEHLSIKNKHSFKEIIPFFYEFLMNKCKKTDCFNWIIELFPYINYNECS